LLTAIADDAFLVDNLRFKGGTCASMRDFLNRFSIDLDFDLLDEENVLEVRGHLELIFEKFGLEIKDQSQNVPQYFLRYLSKGEERNTLKLDVTFPAPRNNDYEPVRLEEIDRFIHCHTVPTMFANKLVALVDRFEKFGSIAGRDVFDIHSFFMQGFSYKKEIIEERTGKSVKEFLEELVSFVKKHVSQTVIDQDLNTLLPASDFRKIRKVLVQEVLGFLEDEIKRTYSSSSST